MFKRTLLTASAASAFLFTNAGVHAQSAGPTTPAANADRGTAIGEIVVTAERREENLQDTPIAVSAFSADTLKKQEAGRRRRPPSGHPGRELHPPPISAVSTSRFAASGRTWSPPASASTAGVSINENELPVSANNFANSEFFDVDRVEIVRGPQGTLYGKNATGGAVDVITTQPSSQFGGYGSIEYGNYNTIKATGAVNIPLGDAFALRVAGRTPGAGRLWGEHLPQPTRRRPRPRRNPRHPGFQTQRPFQRLPPL